LLFFLFIIVECEHPTLSFYSLLLQLEKTVTCT